MWNEWHLLLLKPQIKPPLSYVSHLYLICMQIILCSIIIKDKLVLLQEKLDVCLLNYNIIRGLFKGYVMERRIYLTMWFWSLILGNSPGLSFEKNMSLLFKYCLQSKFLRRQCRKRIWLFIPHPLLSDHDLPKKSARLRHLANCASTPEQNWMRTLHSTTHTDWINE